MWRGTLALAAIAVVGVSVVLLTITSFAVWETSGVILDFPAFVRINVADDPDDHASHIGMPSTIQLRVQISNGDISITGPAPWVDVTGAIEDGQIFASGSGTVAGFEDIAVIFRGKLDLDGLSGQYRMGTDDGLPPDLLGESHPIKYSITPSGAVDEPTPGPTATPTLGGLAAPTDTPPPQPALTPTATPPPTVPGMGAPTDTPVPTQPALTPTATATATLPGLASPTPTATPTPTFFGTHGGRLSLIVVDIADPSEGVPGFQINLHRGGDCSPETLVASGVTDEDGVFSVPDLPQGIYSAFVKAREGWNNGEGFCSGEIQLVLTGSETGLNLTLMVVSDGNGDVNGDGATNSLDALLVLQFIAGLITELPNSLQADVNQDGVVNAVDSQLILQFDAGQLDSLPVGDN